MSTSHTRWYFIRHTPVTTLKGYIYGSTDPSGDVSDKVAFSRLASRIPTNAVWITSHLKRTTQTAQAISAAGYELPQLIVDERFGEQCFGDWHGLSHREHNKTREDGFIGLWNCGPREQPPNGESFVQVMQRVAAAMDYYAQKIKADNIVVVAHGGSIRAAVAHALDLTPENAVALKIENLSITRFEKLNESSEKTPLWRMIGFNEVLHKARGD